jgi:hypothetical protein
MFDLVIPKGAYNRANGNLPPFELVNMLAEETPSAKGGVSLLSFPGLSSLETRGSGPIRGTFRRSDIFGGATFTVSGSTLYMDGTSLGTIDGTGPVRWASSNLELVVTRGARAWSYNGTNLVAITFPDSAHVTAVTFLAGLFLFARAGSRKFYWSAVDDARTIDALDFASAESAPDYLLDLIALGDTLYLGGKEKIEAWYVTGDGSLPFLKISQRTTTKGVAATGCMAELDNALHFIGSDRVVYRMAEVPVRISNHGIEEQLAGSASFAAFSFYWQGHAILMVRLSASSWGYDSTTQQWHERRTNGTNWRAACACQQADGTPLFGSDSTGDLFIHGGWADASDALSREFTAAVPLTSTQILDTIEIECNTGQTDDLTLSPVIEMRRSRDGGNTWSPWRSASLGGTGQYRARSKWRRNGSFDAPGAMLHFRVTDPVSFRVSSAFSGESSAGRPRP